MNIPTITTARLILRPFTQEDVDPLHRILGQEHILRYFPNSDPPPRERVKKLIDHQLKHWQAHKLGWWAVQPRETGEMIGWCGLQYLPETDETEVGYLLSKTHWGKGLATEAARAALEYGFRELNLETIVGIVHPENRASQRVLEKIGLSFDKAAHYFGMDVFHYTLAVSE